MYVAFVTFLLCVQAQLLYSSPPHRQRSFNTEKTLSLSLTRVYVYAVLDRRRRRASKREGLLTKRSWKKRYEAKLDNNRLCKFTICEYIRERLHCCVLLFSSSSTYLTIFLKVLWDFFPFSFHFQFTSGEEFRLQASFLCCRRSWIDVFSNLSKFNFFNLFFSLFNLRVYRDDVKKSLRS